MLNFFLIINIILTITLNKNIFFTTEAFIIIVLFFLTLYNFLYYGI